MQVTTEVRVQVIEDADGFFQRRVEKALHDAITIAEFEGRDLPPLIEIDVKRYRPVPFEYRYEKDKVVFIFQSITRISGDFGHTIEQITEIILQWSSKN